MAKRIAIVGAGAVGGYTGAHMARAGEDVTFIDSWPEHVEEMKRNGLRITHHQGEEPFRVKVRALHLTEAQHLAKEAPVDIAFVCMKSYDTDWAARLIQQYLAPGGYVVSLQNCMNEATIAGVVGWGKTLGCIASNISVGLVEPGHVHRGGVKGGAAHTVYRTGEVHGTHHRPGAGSVPARLPCRQRQGHRQSMGRALVEAGRRTRWRTGSRPAPGSPARRSRKTRRSAISRRGSAARRSASARRAATSSKRSAICRPKSIARAGEGDAAALKHYDEQRLRRAARLAPTSARRWARTWPKAAAPRSNF